MYENLGAPALRGERKEGFRGGEKRKKEACRREVKKRLCLAGHRGSINHCTGSWYVKCQWC